MIATHRDNRALAIAFVLTAVGLAATQDAIVKSMSGGYSINEAVIFRCLGSLPVLVVLSLLWLSWHFIGVVQQQGLGAFMNRPGDGSMGMLSAIDLVMAMPVSWLPLVADYARHGRSARSTLGGTWIGYALANAWCYALGVLVASVSEPSKASSQSRTARSTPWARPARRSASTSANWAKVRAGAISRG